MLQCSHTYYKLIPYGTYITAYRERFSPPRRVSQSNKGLAKLALGLIICNKYDGQAGKAAPQDPQVGHGWEAGPLLGRKDTKRKGVINPFTCACTHTYPPARTHTRTHTCTRTHVHTHVHTQSYTYTCSHVRNPRTHVHAHTHTNTHTHTRTRTRTYAHAHTHAHARTRTRAHARAYTYRCSSEGQKALA